MLFFCPFHRLVKIKEYVDKHDPGATIIPISGAFEQTYIEIEGEDEKKKYLEDNKCARYGTISLQNRWQKLLRLVFIFIFLISIVSKKGHLPSNRRSTT